MGPYSRGMRSATSESTNATTNPTATAITVSSRCSPTRWPISPTWLASQSQRMSGSPGVISASPSAGADLDPPVDPSRLDGAPVLAPSMTLRDALAEMLASETQVGMVRDGDRYLGVLTLSHIGRLLRTEKPK